MKHTPTPWEHSMAGSNHWIFAKDGRSVAFIGGKDTVFTRHPGTPHKANVAFIVQAVNSHEQLVAALVRFLLASSDVRDDFNDQALYDLVQDAIKHGETAIAKAKS